MDNKKEKIFNGSIGLNKQNIKVHVSIDFSLIKEAEGFVAGASGEGFTKERMDSFMGHVKDAFGPLAYMADADTTSTQRITNDDLNIK